MPARLPESIVRPMDRVGSDPPGCGSGEARKNGARTGITERNGIWVLTIGGVWHGDYRKRAQAEAEAARMQQARR
ncbi:MAG: hypothetical protein JJU42_12835 [Rhodobacteraceae bacterium]|nr:hypothetical protein [Paracoccaceae bacterium]